MIKTVIILYIVSTLLAAAVAVVSSTAFPVTLTLSADAASEVTAPGGVSEILKNLILNIVANPIESIVKANYIGVLA